MNIEIIDSAGDRNTAERLQDINWCGGSLQCLWEVFHHSRIAGELFTGYSIRHNTGPDGFPVPSPLEPPGWIFTSPADKCMKLPLRRFNRPT